jgi:hypothetical protein
VQAASCDQTRNYHDSQLRVSVEKSLEHLPDFILLLLQQIESFVENAAHWTTTHLQSNVFPATRSASQVFGVSKD